MKRGFSINKVLRPVQEMAHQAFISNVIQMGDILEWITRQIGECEVWHSSLSTSEGFLRRLHSIRKKGLIKRYTVMLDFRAMKKTVKLAPFLRNIVERVVLADNHSKVLLARALGGGVYIGSLITKPYLRIPI